MDREQGWQTLCEFTNNPALIQHGQCVEAAMRRYADVLGEDVERFGLAGLLHDFDYERWDAAPEHTREGAKILRQRGCDEEVVGAILSHVPWNLDEYPRDRPIRKVLFAVDELCGLIYAAALVRPGRMEGMTPKSIVKKLKTKAFAASVSREDIYAGGELLDMPFNDHIAHCIAAISGIAGEVDLVAAAE